MTLTEFSMDIIHGKSKRQIIFRKNNMEKALRFLDIKTL